MKSRIVAGWWLITGLMAAGLAPRTVQAQGTAFTYQGSLNFNGSPVTGVYSMRFALRTAANGTGQVGALLTNAPVGVTNGLFTTTLDFGNVFATSPLYLEIGVRTNGSSAAFGILSPVQPLTSVPYAVQALAASTASSFTGSIANTQLSATVAQLNSNQIYTGAVTFANLATFTNATGAFSGTFSGTGTGVFTGTNYGIFFGNGANITNLSITNLMGVVQSNPNWQVIQSGSQQAVAGNNYLFTNNTQQTLTLPASPVVGGTVWLSGSGAAGWKVAQNAGQSILTAPFGLPAGQLWTQSSSGTASYHAIGCSTDGTRLAAATQNSTIYYSANGGSTWAASDAPGIYWNSVAVSANGLRMIAGANSTSLYTSSNGGTNWTVQSGSTSAFSYKGVACSASGARLYAVAGSYVIGSPNGGATWTTNFYFTPSGLVSVCCSADGSEVAVCGGSGGTTKIYVSYDYGQTWATNASANNWIAIACSSNGAFLVAASANGNLFTSWDAGTTWTQRATVQGWTAVTCSASGQYMAACYSGGGYIFTSHDYGQTWVQQSNGYSSASQWSGLASTADGSHLFACISTANGVIWLSTAATTVGTGGYLAGSQYANAQLQYVGNGLWMPLSFTGTFTSN